MARCCACRKFYPSTYEGNCWCGGGIIEMIDDDDIFLDVIGEDIQ